MAHFARLDENNNVIAVHVIHNNECLIDGVENEQKGIDFLTNLHKHNKWKQTSYNTVGNVHLLGGTPLRKNFAVNGGTYNTIHDAFISPRPYDIYGNVMNSWHVNVLSGSFLWDPPISLPEVPNANVLYYWNESNHQSNNKIGWDLYFIEKTGNLTLL